MNESGKVKLSHTRRAAFVYIRQSSPSQVEYNRESTARQYALVERACELGWAKEQVIVVDEDLGLSGSGSVKRSGFARMTAEVALGHVGIVLGLEVSRLARNNADWYRLLDLCGMTDTLIGDSDGIYHPALFNDRLILGLKGTMSEAELHILRARLDGGIRNKAARGELRRGLPVGFVWGEEDGEVRFQPDEAVVGAIRTVFSKFTELGSARKVWLWFRSEGLSFPLRATMNSLIRWVAPTYTAIHHVLTNPVYAGAYAYGKCRHERYVDEQGRFRRRTRHLPQAEWAVLLPDHHPGFIDWATYQANQTRIDANVHPQPHRMRRPAREDRERRTAARSGHLRQVWPPSAYSLSRQKCFARLSLLGQRHRPGSRRLLSQRRRYPDRSGGSGCVSESVDARCGGSYRTGYAATRNGSGYGTRSVAPGGRTCAL